MQQEYSSRLKMFEKVQLRIRLVEKADKEVENQLKKAKATIEAKREEFQKNEDKLELIKDRIGHLQSNVE